MKTLRIHRKNIHSYCRTCLTELASTSSNNGLKFDIHRTQDLTEWIVVCTSVEVDNTDGYPKYLCQMCFTNFQSFYKFRGMCIRSKRILDDILKTVSNDDTTKVELSDDENHQSYHESTGWLEIESEIDHPEKSDEVKRDDNTMVTATTLQEIYTEHIEFDGEREVPIFTNDLETFNNKQSVTYNGESKEGFTDDEMTSNKKSFEYKNCSELENNEDSMESMEKSSYTLELESERNQDGKEASSTEDLSLKGDHFPTEMIEEEEDEEVDSNSEKSRKKPDAKFQCELCKKRCLRLDNLEAHMRTHQGLKPFQCSQCERSYTKAYHLKKHVRDSHQDSAEQITCSFEGCGKQFRRDATYRVHYRLKHTDAKPILKTYMCEDCGRTFKNISTLKEHRFKHIPEEEYPFQCDQCGKRYTSQRTYKEHLMRHAGIKNFVCPYCGMKKTTRNELRTHINYHTKEKQWPCPHCPSVFNSSANLGLHDRVVHKGIRRYACRYCEQSFGKAETLKHHEMRHTGEKPHECHICEKRFIQVVALRAHLKTHNKVGGRNATKQQKHQQSNSVSSEEVSNACLTVVRELDVV